jgi:hypothetical protein
MRVSCVDAGSKRVIVIMAASLADESRLNRRALVRAETKR